MLSVRTWMLALGACALAASLFFLVQKARADCSEYPWPCGNTCLNQAACLDDCVCDDELGVCV